MAVGAAVAASDCRRFGGLWPDGSAVARGGIFFCKSACCSRLHPSSYSLAGANEKAMAWQQ